MRDWKINKKSNFIHYCPNETIDSISINEEPNFSDKFVITDCSSNILSKKINIENYSLIYASV
ncbi:hypothetical protein ONB71_02195 [Candidatus Purcelliella pentastirinorum]|uniref:Uncharacterized protein n=1 Tax=Candidatus Purcelliella pentastirinorum TaxID=472834 RepID=A0AAX3NAG1_9ENTR|nr:hypothetical protein [Candidatus Purcelliella pentastirinorum]WDI78493.1 hypothetical protein ONB71_02195 [Candidatus Purcelliella pentastirinorum]